jgi:hypothetical protein
LTVSDVRSIITSAIEPAISDKVRIGEVSADLLGGAVEIIEGSRLVGQDVAGGDEYGVSADTLAGVGEPEGVVKGEICFVVGEAVEVPVGLSGWVSIR